MLYTNLKHIESASAFIQIVTGYESVVVICGKMDPTSVSMYRIAEELDTEYKNVQFFDMEFDNPESSAIRRLPQVQELNGVPLMVFFKLGEVVRVTDGIRVKSEIISALEHEFAETVIG